MSRYWSAVVHDLQPYVPGEQPQLERLIKLNTNEHPYGPSPRALEAIRDAANDRLRLYPDPQARQLTHALAQRCGVSDDQVFVGNGSDEVLAHIFAGLLRQPEPLWFPDITYSFYPVYCGLYGVEYATLPLDEHFRLRADDYLPRNDRRAGGIIFANPNAPTGIHLPLEEVERIVAGNPHCVVVVDEAYVDFGGHSALPLVAHYPNLLVVQTFSKSRSLAGLRVGFAVGHADLITALDRVKNSFNSYPLDRLALAGAEASLADEDYFNDHVFRILASRERLIATLSELGFETLPSAANFVFTRHPRHAGAALAAALRERSIIVRHFERPRIEHYLRITIGSESECTALVAALQEIVG